MSNLMISDKADVLLLDDQPENLHLLVSLLIGEFQVHPFTDPAQFAEYINGGKPVDLILLDVVMPGRDGYEICAWLRTISALEHVPIIFLTSLNGVEDERKGLALGANDYIGKPFSPPIVLSRVRHHVDLGRSLRIIADQNDNLDEKVRERTADLQFQAFHDGLTRLRNRRRLEDTLAEALARGQSGALILLQLERLQKVVDSLGYAFADRVLVALAERLESLGGDALPASSMYRFEGALFAVLMPEIGHAAQPAALAARIAEEMQKSLFVDGREMFFTFTAGIAHFPEDGAGGGDVLRNADTALQNAKRAGATVAVRYEAQMSAKLLDRLELEHQLRHAAERGELELHYQPQLEIGGGRMIGVEALVRWRHPVRGMISPAEFIPLAEETGAIHEIGLWVLGTACAQNRQWQEEGFPPMVMAVNLSPRQFLSPDLPGQVKSVLHLTGLAPQWLELEITEGAVMHDVEAAIGSMVAFKAIGASLSIDDFGTGFSSLAYLSRFPIDKLKVDQSFVRKLDRSERDCAIVRAIIALGQALGLTVIAEGVETEAQRAILARFGCDECQGYLFSRPRPPAELRALLEAQKNVLNEMEPG